ncbi:MAG: ABC transporter permease subunit, partial [Clostridia bacterium]|nr:ABC transporter permease subunit [Clostridia bacterium]
CIIIGADFNNGIARTKILSGHRRSKIYASNLITSFVIAAAINAVYLLMFIAIALPIFAKITISASDAVWLILDGTLMLFAYSAIITMIVTISKNTTAATIICFSLLFIGMILFQYLNNLISQPPMIENVYINDLGEVVSEIVPNSNMPSKAAKAFYQFLVDLFPSGQSLQLATGADYNNWQMALYSLGIIGATTGAGMIAFNKTDIK